MAKKKPNKAERAHMNAVADLGCIVCLNLGNGYVPASIHHTGLGRNHFKVIGLCTPGHHQLGGFGVAIHDGQGEWEKNFGTEEELLIQTNELLGIL